MTLTIDELFIPKPSGVGPSVPPAGSWMSVLITQAQTLGLPTTSWQAGEPERTILAIDAVALSQQDAVVSLAAQGGFLDFAASGTVSYVALNGQTVIAPVTPDPSIPSQNPTGRPGWLDLLASSSYGVTRLEATYASGTLAIANTSVSAQGPFLAGTYHVANTLTKATYANTSSLTIDSSIIAANGGVITGISVGLPTTVTTQAAHSLSIGSVVYVDGINGVTGLNGVFAQVTATPTTTSFQVSVLTVGTWTSGGTVYECTQTTMAADVIGIDSNAAPAAVSTTVTQLTGVFVSNLTSWSASPWESNVALAARCRLKLASFSPAGASDAYEYVALTAQATLAAQVPPITLTNGPIVSAVTSANPTTGEVTTTIASSSPASSVLGEAVTPGCAQLEVTNAGGTPIVITTAAPHNLLTGYVATVADVGGNTNANVTSTVTVLSPTTFELDGTTSGPSSYTTGGTVEGGDLGQVDLLLQNNVVPDGIVAAFTASALALPIDVSATVAVPQAFVATYTAAVGNALVAYLRALPIGGNDGVVPISAIEGVLFNAGAQAGSPAFVRSITGLTVNAGVVDVPYPTDQYVAISGTNTISVVGV